MSRSRSVRLIERDAHDLFAVAAFRQLQQAIPGEIPIGTLARIRRRFEHLLFPVGLQCGDVVLLEQRAPFGPVFVATLYIRSDLARQRRVDICFFDVLEERKELVIVLLADGIVLVVVALRAAHRESHPGGCDGVRAIEGGFESELIVVDAAFTIRQGLAVETSCDAVVGRWRREEDPRQPARS